MDAISEWRKIAMKAFINSIMITDRVRKEITKIDELAADIEANGLLNPITVMSLEGEEYRLLAGLRRLRALEKLGYSEVDINIVSPADAEAALRIEISENEQREPFTFSEKMDFARMLEEIEQAKARERMSLGGKGGMDQEGTDRGPYLEKKESRCAIGEKIGMSGRQYSRAKHIADNAPEEIIDELDKGQRSIRGTYDEMRAKEKANKPLADANCEEFPVDSDLDIEYEVETISESTGVSETNKNHRKPEVHDKTETPSLLSKSDQEAIERNKAFNAMSPLEKIEELQRQLKEERARAAHAESELARLKELRHNDVYHKDGIINNLKARLAEAEARVRELEGLIA